jgi:hypothetical protein
MDTGDREHVGAHGDEVAFGQGRPKKLWKAITYDLGLGFEHDYSHWKYLDEKKTMVPSRRGFEMVEEK